jgi:putative ABC transport system ATP-binding protein/lipoprotein-releasing system ATP-binding protein
MSEPVVRAEGVGLSYGSGATATVAVQPASFSVEAGGRVALVGPSGSGKSSLLHMMAALETPTLGSLTWPALGPREELRPGPVAIVFQGPSLLPPLSINENVALPLILAGHAPAEAARRADEVLGLLGLAALSGRLPEDVSGGEAQRVAIARALAGGPRLLLADEPTGQLDSATAATTLQTLFDAATEAGAALVVATHDLAVADLLSDRWAMTDGALRVTDLEPA